MVFDDDTEAPHSFRFQPPKLAQPRHPMPPTPNASARRLTPEFDRPILFPHLLMDLAEQMEHALIFDGACTARAISPGIVAAATDGQGVTEPRHSIGSLLSSDKRVSHVDSLAKYPAAFFKMSRSSMTRANSRLRRAISAAASGCRPEPGNAPPCAATCFCHL